MEVLIEIRKYGVLDQENTIWRPAFVVRHSRHTSYAFTKKEAEALAKDFESTYGGEAIIVSAIKYTKWIYEPDGFTVTAVEKRAKSSKRIRPKKTVKVKAPSIFELLDKTTLAKMGIVRKQREMKHHLTSLTPAKQKRLEAGKPLFGHDCRKCKFLGSFQSPENNWWYDLYFCGSNGFDSIRESVLARYGYDGNYSSGFFLGISQLVEAMKRAVQNGLITNFDLSNSGLWPEQREELEKKIKEWLEEKK